VQGRKLAQNASSTNLFEFGDHTPRSRDPKARPYQRTCTNKDYRGFRTDLHGSKTPLNLSKQFGFEEYTKENYWKQRVDLLIYEKKKWLTDK